MHAFPLLATKRKARKGAGGYKTTTASVFPCSSHISSLFEIVHRLWSIPHAAKSHDIDIYKQASLFVYECPVYVQALQNQTVSIALFPTVRNKRHGRFCILLYSPEAYGGWYS